MARTLLRIDSSPRADGRSHSRRLTARFEEVWRSHNPAGRVVWRDLRLRVPQHVDQAGIEAAFAAEFRLAGLVRLWLRVVQGRPHLARRFFGAGPVRYAA